MPDENDITKARLELRTETIRILNLDEAQRAEAIKGLAKFVTAASPTCKTPVSRLAQQTEAPYEDAMAALTAFL